MDIETYHRLRASIDEIYNESSWEAFELGEYIVAQRAILDSFDFIDYSEEIEPDDPEPDEAPVLKLAANL